MKGPYDLFITIANRHLKKYLTKMSQLYYPLLLQVHATKLCKAHYNLVSDVINDVFKT